MLLNPAVSEVSRAQGFLIHGPCLLFFTRPGWHLVSIVYNGRVPSDTGNKQGLDPVRLECEANQFGPNPGVAGNHGGLLSRGKTWSLLQKLQSPSLCPRPKPGPLPVTLVLKSQIPPSTLSEVDSKSKDFNECGYHPWVRNQVAFKSMYGFIPPPRPRQCRKEYYLKR